MVTLLSDAAKSSPPETRGQFVKMIPFRIVPASALLQRCDTSGRGFLCPKKAPATAATTPGTGTSLMCVVRDARHEIAPAVGHRRTCLGVLPAFALVGAHLVDRGGDRRGPSVHGLGIGVCDDEAAE
jgi:hypothetical protein